MHPTEILSLKIDKLLANSISKALKSIRIYIEITQWKYKEIDSVPEWTCILCYSESIRMVLKCLKESFIQKKW